MKKQPLLCLLCSSAFLLTSCGNRAASSSFASDSKNVTTSQKGDVAVSSLSIQNKITSLPVGESYRLNVKISPENATNYLVNFASSNPSVASIDLDGNITALSAGTTTIKACSDENPSIQDSFTLTVTSLPITAFNVIWPEDVETVTINNKTFKKLVVGKNYPLSFTFTPAEQNGEILASFSSSNYATFDAQTNGLTITQEVADLTVTFSVKGTNLSQSFSIRGMSQGKLDREVAYAKMQESQKKETESDASHQPIEYRFTYSSSYYNIDGVKVAHQWEETFHPYREGLRYYSLTQKQESIQKGLDPVDTINSTVYKGIGNDNETYYEFEIDKDGNHLESQNAAIKKSIGKENSSNTITQEQATLNATKLSHNQHYGLSDIAAQFVNPSSAGYDYFEGSTNSHIYSFTGDAAAHSKYTMTEHGFQVTADYVEKEPSSWSDGQVYFNRGEFVFDADGILSSVTIHNDCYDKNGYDFTNHTLSDNAKPVATYDLSYAQTLGKLGAETTPSINTNDLNFTDYTLAVVSAGKTINPDALTAGQTYSFAVATRAPSIASVYFDPIYLTDVSDDKVVSIVNGGLGFKVLTAGSATLTFYSRKNNKKYEMDVSTVLPDALSLKAYVGKEEKTSFTTMVGKEVSNIRFVTNPTESKQAKEDPSISIRDSKGKDTTAASFSKVSDGSFTFLSNTAGTYQVIATTSNQLSVTLTFVVNAPVSGSLSDSVIQKQYCWKEGEGIDYVSLLITFDSKTSGKVYGSTDEDMKSLSEARYSASFTCVFDDATKTVTFADVTTIDDIGWDSYGITIQGKATISDDASSLNGIGICYYDDGTDYKPANADFEALSINLK